MVELGLLEGEIRDELINKSILARRGMDSLGGLSGENLLRLSFILRLSSNSDIINLFSVVC